MANTGHTSDAFPCSQGNPSPRWKNSSHHSCCTVAPSMCVQKYCAGFCTWPPHLDSFSFSVLLSVSGGWPLWTASLKLCGPLAFWLQAFSQWEAVARARRVGGERGWGIHSLILSFWSWSLGVLPPICQPQLPWGSCRLRGGNSFQLSPVPGSLSIFGLFPYPCPHLHLSLSG